MSRYIREVRRGGEIQVLDRGHPVARLVPERESGDETREMLIKSGLVRPGHGSPKSILEQDPVVLPVSISAALEEDRADRL